MNMYKYTKSNHEKKKHSCTSEHSSKDRKKLMVHIYKKTTQTRFPFFHPMVSRKIRKTREVT